MTLVLFISEERLVPLFQEEDQQQQLLMGLVRAFVTVCTRGRTTSTNAKSKIVSSRAWCSLRVAVGHIWYFLSSGVHGHDVSISS